MTQILKNKQFSVFHTVKISNLQLQLHHISSPEFHSIFLIIFFKSNPSLSSFQFHLGKKYSEDTTRGPNFYSSPCYPISQYGQVYLSNLIQPQSEKDIIFFLIRWGSHRDKSNHFCTQPLVLYNKRIQPFYAQLSISLHIIIRLAQVCPPLIFSLSPTLPLYSCLTQT